MKRIGVIVSARMASSRLPGKAMLPLGGMPVIEFLMTRLKASTYFSHVILATTNQADDDVLAQHMNRINVPIFRGDKDDLVSRYLGAADEFQFDTLVRITGDCPFLNGAVLDYFVAECEKKTEFDLATTKGAFPIGLDFELFSTESLRQWHENGNLTAWQREHLTLAYYEKPAKIAQVKPPQAWTKTKQHYTLDTIEDFHFQQSIVKKFQGNPNFSVTDLLSLS